MSRSATARALRLLLPLAVALAVCPAAEAGRWQLLPRITRPAPRGPGTVAAGGLRHRAGKVSRALARKARGRTILAVARDRQAQSYARDLRDTVEILFQPRASSYGHMLVRIGERIYDMPDSFGPRAQSFEDAVRWVHSPMYGFVFDSTPQRVAELDRAFRDLVASRPAFSPMGSGPDGYSCAAFVTSVLASRAPELNIGMTVGAIGLASHLLSGGGHQALTLYGDAARDAGSESFAFERIE